MSTEYPPAAKEFGKAFKEIRLKNRFTQSELGKKLNVTGAHISNVQNGDRIMSAETLGVFLQLTTPNDAELESLVAPYGHLLEKGLGVPSGEMRSEETRRKMSEAQMGKTLSEETRRKISEAHKGRTSPMKGKIHSKEARRKMREVQNGRTRSEETRRKMSEAQIRRWEREKQQNNAIVLETGIQRTIS